MLPSRAQLGMACVWLRTQVNADPERPDTDT